MRRVEKGNVKGALETAWFCCSSVLCTDDCESGNAQPSLVCVAIQTVMASRSMFSIVDEPLQG